MPQTELTLRRPDDWHIHLRDGVMLQSVLPFTSKEFGRAIVMPNLVPPISNTALAEKYRDQILQAIPTGHAFTPLMTVYLTESADPLDYQRGFESGVLTAAKLYPAGATTNSDAGVRNLKAIYPILEVMQTLGMPLLIHGEVVDPEIDIFDREAVFIEQKLIPLRQDFPELKIVFEHITTFDGVEYVQSCAANTAATITPHHLVVNRNAMFVGGIRPHYYCLPVAKREQHRQALLLAATSGDQRFFLGTDSAPHTIGAKESACGCAGIFNVPVTLPVLAQIFEDVDALDQLERFCSKSGPAFYGLPENQEKVQLVKHSEAIELPEYVVAGEHKIKVFDPEFPLYWQYSAE